MPWLKRNLFLVVGGVVALALMGIAGYFLFAKIQQNQEVTDQLNAKTDELKSLVSRDPHPGTDKIDNIRAAKEETKKLEAFLAGVKKYFPEVAYSSTNHLTTPEFRALLDTSIDDLQRGAERSGVEIPTNYWFTFAAQKSSMTFATNVLGPLSAQLTEIKSLCEILFEAKVVGLLGLRRVAVATEDSGSQDYLSNKPVTNEYAIVTPYEVSFQGFSTELASVMEGLIRSKTCYVIRNVSVERGDATTVHEAVASPYGNAPYNPSRDPRYGLNPAQRYGPQGGEGRRYSPPPPVVPNPVPARPSGKGYFLDEKALKVTLMLDVVKLKPSVKPAK
jgi:hypothetical protein